MHLDVTRQNNKNRAFTLNYIDVLSILIPTHNYTCYTLVADLHSQAETLGVPYEIIVAEDGSRDSVSIIANHKIEELSNCRHVIGKENVGLATTRNRLARQALYDWILFIDCDARVEKADFLASYVAAMGKADVIVGGLYHPQKNDNPQRSLRFKYEKEADKVRGAAFRNQNPYSKFSAFNCMVRRSVFLCILFDEQCRYYGYEDALFGVELKHRGISVLHIDNPLMHTGIDTNQAFLEKTDTALHTLYDLGGKMRGGSAILQVYDKFSRHHLSWLLRGCHTLCGWLMRRNLLSAHPSLSVFSLYKLCRYAHICSQDK